MEKWLIFDIPYILIPVIVALILSVFERITRLTHGVLTIISTAVVLICAALLFLAGADMYEIITILLLFLLLNMGEKA